MHKNLYRTVFATHALCISLRAADPMAGTWLLDTSKSSPDGKTQTITGYTLNSKGEKVKLYSLYNKR